MDLNITDFITYDHINLFKYFKEFPINPKALNLAELYGEFNLATNEWMDGVISNIMRSCCACKSLNTTT